jgi:hypothetical protein
VTPFQVNPSCISSDKSNRHPALSAAAKMTASPDIQFVINRQIGLRPKKLHGKFQLQESCFASSK